MNDLYYVTSKNIVDTDLDEEFVYAIKKFESKGTRVHCEDIDSEDAVISPESGHFPCGRNHWYHDNIQWPVLIKNKPIIVTLEDELFEL